MKVQVTCGQLAATLLISRLLSNCVNIPAVTANYNMQTFAVTVIVKVVALALLTAPMCLNRMTRTAVNADAPGINFFDIIAGKSKVAGWILFIPLGGFLFFQALLTSVMLEFFVGNTIMDTASSTVLTILCGAGVAYCFIKGIKAVCKAGSVIMCVFIAVFVLCSIPLIFNERWYYLYPKIFDQPNELLEQMRNEMVKCWELFAFLILGKYVKRSPNKTVFLYMPASLIILELMHLTYVVMFGAYLNEISFPLYSLASLTDIVIFPRLDGLDVFIWTVSAVLRITLLMMSFTSLLETLLGNSKIAKRIGIVFMVIGNVMSAYVSETGRGLMKGSYWVWDVAYFGVFLIAAPVAAMIIFKTAGGRPKIPSESTAGENNPSI
ncbi:hypothetical protein FACS189499_05250 [Clostridia bacterium]|nr:hypothetical protein FACS189499_05250 [Clostridia bacterium]